MMNAIVAVVPLILIRYGLLVLINREALRRAAFFAPPLGSEKVAFWVYQLSTVFLLLYPLLLKIQPSSAWFYVGLSVYFVGLLLVVLSTLHFAHPAGSGINTRGLYRVSRHPMYVSYFLFFLGCVLLTQSWILLAGLVVFQVSSHWIILAEERWCKTQFGLEYVKYMNTVRRYL